MARRVAQKDWDDEDDDDRDDGGFDPPDEEWQPDTDDDDDETDPCPWCGKPVYEGAERCPSCEKYLSEEDAPASSQPRWVTVTAIIVLVCIVAFWGILGR